MRITVAIGRNVGREPMNDADWLDFIASIGTALKVNGFTVTDSERGTAHYDGTTEEHRRWFADGPNLNVPSLKRNLAAIAAGFEQESIYYAEVNATFIPADASAITRSECEE